MPRLYPKVAAEDIRHQSERVVYEALLQLEADYVVMHSFPWLRPMRNILSEPLNEGEADFLILHPEYGFLVLEVKGGQLSYKDRDWFQNERKMRDPFEQARRNRYALIDAIEERTKGRVNRGMFTHGDSVVFPNCKFIGELPLNSDPRIVMDHDHLPELGKKLPQAFKAWRRSDKPMSPTVFEDVIETLMPRLRLMRCIGSEMLAERQRIIQITQDQSTSLQGLLANDRVLVEGTAGSGKTFLAMEFAISMVQSGQDILVLCFNKHLAKWLQESVSNEGRLKGLSSKLEISTYHSYAVTLARRAGVQFEVPDADPHKFWEEEVPLILEQAIEVLKRKGLAPTFGAVVIDEAQDFSPDWWVTVESLSKKGKAGRVYAFLDLNQSLRTVAAEPTISFATRFKLQTNCRNTQNIAKSSRGILDVEFVILSAAPHGEVPKLFRAGSGLEDVRAVESEVSKLLESGILPNQVALIGPKAYGSGPLSALSAINGVPITDDASDWRRGGGILATTARAFKGLEADVVVLYDLGGFGPGFTKTDLYVAWTRARHRIVAVCHGAEVRETIERALSEIGDLGPDDL